jgi:tryptophanyl-tRNA synthetase
VPQTELSWYLSCFFSTIDLSTFFKDKSDRLDDVNAGLLVIHVMAADILLYDAEIVPVGKDQLQHLEITVMWLQDSTTKWENFVFQRLKLKTAC